MKEQTQLTDNEIRDAIKALKSAEISKEEMKFFAYCNTHEKVHLIKKGCKPYIIYEK